MELIKAAVLRLCGVCRTVRRECGNLEWRYPRGSFGVSYRTG